jgi:cytochrome P450/NADPH-cytochrome P450 reductase
MLLFFSVFLCASGAAESVGRHPHAYKPFGFGVRSCVGSQFALWEAKTLIPLLYHNFTFKLVENLKLKPSRSVQL